MTTQQHLEPPLSKSRSDLNRQRAKQAGVKCPQVKGLRELCKFLNKDAGRVIYHVDHILPFHMGGRDVIDNLWIVPAEWNENTIINRPVEMILFIHQWVLDNGRLCTSIPQGLKELEMQIRRKELEAMNFQFIDGEVRAPVIPGGLSERG